VAHPSWGSAGINFIRIAPSNYGDGRATPSGANRPSARLISNKVAAHPSTEKLSARGLSNFVYAWGQFIDHDLDLTETLSTAGSLPISVPRGDPSFDPQSTGNVTIPLTRSKYTGGVNSPREQVNSITGFLDGSMVYGSDRTTALSLRTMSNGRMKTSNNSLLPLDATGSFVAGDIRVNENPELTSVQTLFVREHNQIASRLQQQNPSWNDETLYQESRRRVIAEIQAITYNEWLPVLLPTPLPPYQGYAPDVNPSISNEFAAGAFRFGHSMVGDDIRFLDNDGKEIAPAMLLKNAFFNPQVVKQYNIDPLLKYLASDLAEELDSFVVDSLRNFLFGAPGQGGMDLAALNIQRGRDHGLSNLNAVRVAYGLPKVTAFTQITANGALQQQLQTLYGNVDNIDLWVGGLAEDKVPGGNLGPTFTKIITNQFHRLRAGDFYWYEKDFQGTPELPILQSTRLSQVIKRNTKLTKVQLNVFLVNTSLVRQRHHAAGSQETSTNKGLETNRWNIFSVPCMTALFVMFVVIAIVLVAKRSFSRHSSMTAEHEAVNQSVPSGFLTPPPVASSDSSLSMV